MAAKHLTTPTTVNVHGCGIGWYGSHPGGGLVDGAGCSSYERPAVYTSTQAPSHDRNLRSLAKMVETGLLFGHVRAAGPGAAVHQFNCHPFQAGRYLFMHNGDVDRFKELRRGLLSRLRDCLFDWISGTTDSELLFALFLNALPDAVSQHSPEVLAAALRDTIALVVEVTGGAPSSLNIAVTDGETVLATRFRNGSGEVPPSLYYHTGTLSCAAWDLAPAGAGLGGLTGGLTQDGLLVAESHAPLGANAESGLDLLSRRNSFERRQQHPRQCLLVSSEPLTEDGADAAEWRVFPANTLLVAKPVWRGGTRHGAPASRWQLNQSAQADECAEGEAAVVLDTKFESLAHLADWTPTMGLSKLRPARRGTSPDNGLPPKPPGRSSFAASAASPCSAAPAEERLDIAALSFTGE